MQRFIVLDTETTGFSPEKGDKVIEIGCVEIIDRKITNNSYHVYINPNREVPYGAFKVHGISSILEKITIPTRSSLAAFQKCHKPHERLRKRHS